MDVHVWASVVILQWNRGPICRSVLDEGAEAYVTPVGPHLVGVAFLFDPEFGARNGKTDTRNRYERLLDAFLSQGAAHQSRTAIRGAGPFEQRVRARVQGRVLLIGDAAGYLDPITGEGFALDWPPHTPPSAVS